MKNTLALIIGYGSIGSRHARLLGTMGCRICVVTKRNDCPYVRYGEVKEALAAERPDFAVISNPTSRHYDTIRDLKEAGFSGLIFVEKPLFANTQESLLPFTQEVFLGYNLRYHPVIQKIRELLQGRQVFSVQLAVGQYLPDWRPGVDYRHCYSAKRSEGGGALRDLSHEIDLALWLFGPWIRVAALAGKLGNLEIETEDTVDVMAVLTGCPSVTIHLDYHNCFPRRLIAIQADGMSLEGDLIRHVLRINDESIAFDVDRDQTYIAEWQDILSLAPKYACRAVEGFEVVKFIDAVERAARNGIWEINNK